MPFGCFGKRKKPRERGDEPGDGKGPLIDGGTNNSNKNNNSSSLAGKPGDNTEVTEEVIAVARAHSLHASAPNSVENRRTAIGIQKSATLARYDFLRKSDYANTADRWAALKQQYLQAGAEEQQPQRNGAPGGGAGPVKRAAQSLPRQFAPPSTVRFSQWFYERQTMETDARREFHEREEKARKLLDGIEDASVQEETAAEVSRTAADQQSQEEVAMNDDSAADATKQAAADVQQNTPADSKQDSAVTDDAATEPQLADQPPGSDSPVTPVQDKAMSDEVMKGQHAEEDRCLLPNDNNPAAEVDQNQQQQQPQQEEAVEEVAGPSLDDKNAAAIKIQANFKGYRTRKVLGKLPNQH